MKRIWKRMALCCCLVIGMGAGGSSQSFAASSQGSSAATLQQANREGKHLYLFLYRTQDPKTQHLQQVFDRAHERLQQEALFLVLQVDDPSEGDFVRAYDLQRAPMPFVLVLAPNGAIVNGFPAGFSEDDLSRSLSSPGMAQCLKALQQGKMVILAVQSPVSQDREGALQGVRDFLSDPRFGSKTELVMIDPTDAKEQKFLQQVGVSSQGRVALTVLMVPPGDVIARLEGNTTKAQLTEVVKRASSDCGCSGGQCCPGGNCQ